MQVLVRGRDIGMLAHCAFVVLAMATVSLAGPLNGDFEQGTLNGWTQSGDGNAQIIAPGDLAPLGPITGSYSGFVHNGPDDAASIGILTSSPFISPTQGGTLSFSWDFLTAEYTGLDFWDLGSGLDTFNIELVDILAATSEVLASGNVSESGFTYLGAVSAPDGTSYFEHTGVATLTRVFTGAGSYRLRFTVEDGDFYDPDLDEWFFDNYFDSALLIDDVSFLANDPPPLPGPIPEPSTLALVALSGLAVLVVRRRRR